ncbi:MAG: NUDIX hydrolase [Propionibacteriaceae bacterium]
MSADDPAPVRAFLPVAPDDPAERPVVHRTAVRVILVDEVDRVLLFADSDPLLPEFAWWVTPGGGIDRGETEREAAVRELREETGCVVAETDLAGPIASRRAVHGYSDQVINQYETLYAVRVPPFEVDVAGHTEEEKVTLTRHRWWSRAELISTDAWLWPKELVRLWDLLEQPAAWPVELGEVTDESTRPV